MTPGLAANFHDALARLAGIPWTTYVLTLGATLVAGLVQGVTGFGFGIVAMSLLPLLLGFKDALTLTIVLSPLVMLLALHWQKQSFHGRDAWLIIAGALIGIHAGAMLVHALPGTLLLGLLGAILMVVGFGHFVRRRHSVAPARPLWEVPLGVASGVLGIGFAMGGAPIIAYAYSRDWQLERAKAMLTAVFAAETIVMLFFIRLTSEHLDRVLLLALIMILPVLLVLWCGIHLGRRLPQTLMRHAVHAYLGVIGLYYLLSRVLRA